MAEFYVLKRDIGRFNEGDIVERIFQRHNCSADAWVTNRAVISQCGKTGVPVLEIEYVSLADLELLEEFVDEPTITFRDVRYY